eukprot:TRINITY_DN15678_c0_g1_i1.p1 TRINITY_DN15678_c0_g1~~TRINITY_DN15678_c0_g1_i1.p1  ORF type:complete len:906 (+),score=208.85 TRINITY_DN15678_c0_g1_i1:161-2878(+)
MASLAQRLRDLGTRPPSADDVRRVLGSRYTYPDGKSLGMCLKDLARARVPHTAVRLLEVLAEADVPLNAIHYSVGISACSRSSLWRHALGLLSNMERDGVAADVVVLNAALSAMERGGEWPHALRLLGDLHKWGVAPDRVSYNTAISACKRGANWRMALKLLETMSRHEVAKDTITYNSAISACERDGQWAMALHLFASMKTSAAARPDKISFSSLMSACEKGGRWNVALEVLHAMKSGRVAADTIAYSAAISACARGGKWGSAFAVLSTMEEEMIVADTITYNSVLSACANAGFWQMAVAVFGDMPERKVARDTITYDTLISSCEKGEQWPLAVHLLGKMAEDRVPRNVVTFNAALSACEKGGQWQIALELIDAMERCNLHSDTITCSAAISACEKASEWSVAISLFCKMAEQKIDRNAVTYNAVISACEKGGRCGEALELLRVMKAEKIDPDIITLSAVVSAIASQQRWEATALADLAQQLLEDMRRGKAVLDMNGYSLLLTEVEQMADALGEDRLLRSCAAACAAKEVSQSDLQAAAVNAAAARSVADGKLQAAEQLLRRGAEDGFWNSASGCLWQGCSAADENIGWLARVRQRRIAKAGVPAAVRMHRQPERLFTASAKELRMMHYVLQRATPGNAESVCKTMEEFCEVEYQTQGSWSKVAGDAKADVLCAALCRGPPGDAILEVGTYCGYTAMRIAMALPDIQLTTIEVDPAHVIVARNMIALAGLAGRVKVCAGHSKYVLGRLQSNAGQRNGPPKFSAVFMDRWGSQYLEDFDLLERCDLLAPGAVIVADNVLWTGAALYLWQLSTGNAYRTQTVPVQEVATMQEDWMSVSVRCPAAESAHSLEPAEPPRTVAELHEEAEHMRERVFGGGASGAVAPAERAEFAAKMQSMMQEVLASNS